MTYHESKLVKPTDTLYKAYYNGKDVAFNQIKASDCEDVIEILAYSRTKVKAIIEAIEDNEELMTNCTIENRYYKEALKKYLS